MLPIPVLEVLNTSWNYLFWVLARIHVNARFLKGSGHLLAATTQYVLPCLMLDEKRLKWVFIG